MGTIAQEIAQGWADQGAAIAAGQTAESGHSHEIPDVETLTAALANKVGVEAIGQTVAPLVGGAVPLENLPSIPMGTTHEVANQAAMLAIAATVGDFAVIAGTATYRLKALPANSLGNWVELPVTPGVTSVQGLSGAVMLPVATPSADGLMAAADKTAIATNTTNIATNTSAIATNTSALASKADLSSGVVPATQLGSGTANSTTYLRGDRTWQAISTGTTWDTAPGSTYTAVANTRIFVTGANCAITLPDPASGSIEIINSTATTATVTRSGSATISGVVPSTGTAFSAQTSGRVLAGGRGLLTAVSGNWATQGVSGVLVFAYNGTPLSSNSSNPSSASDLFHYLGIVQGGGTWTNPANTTQLVSAASSVEGGTVAILTDRVTSGQGFRTTDTAGSWVGWQFTKPFRCTGFWLQTRGDFDSHHLRNFEVRVNTGSGLTSGSVITGWAIAQTYSNQTQITGLNGYFYFSITTPVAGNQLAIRGSGVTSSGTNYVTAQEFNLFGEYETQ